MTAVLTDEGSAQLETACPGHLASVRRLVFDRLKGVDLVALARAIAATTADEPFGRPAACLPKPTNYPEPLQAQPIGLLRSEFDLGDSALGDAYPPGCLSLGQGEGDTASCEAVSVSIDQPSRSSDCSEPVGDLVGSPPASGLRHPAPSRAAARRGGGGGEDGEAARAAGRTTA